MSGSGRCTVGAAQRVRHLQRRPVVKALCPLCLLPLVVSCHLDKLVNGGGGRVPPSQNPPAALVFATEPGVPRAGQAITPPVRVSVVDSAGVPVANADTLNVTVALGRNPGGASLQGNTHATPVDGIATFPDLRLDKVAAGYALTASAGALPAAMSDTFTVAPGPPTTLAFTVQPAAATQDSALKPPVRVTAYDSLGNITTNWSGAIRVALGADASAGKNARLTGTTTAAAVAGVATFANLRIDQPGTGYTLTAAFGSSAAVATSASFDITPGTPPPTTGSLTVATATTGVSLDPDGYTVSVDGNTLSGIGLNQTATFNGLSAGSHSVELGGVAANCSVSGGTSRSVSVPAGGTAQTSFDVSCAAPPNQPPTAAFGSSCNGLTCSFTSASSDPDGSIASYAWTFGDGGTATSQNPSHPYGAGGTYTVTLTVTDSQGATGNVSHSVTVSAPPPPTQPPTVNAGPDETVLIGALYSLTASFSDPDHDGPWTYTIDWGDGSSSRGSASSEGSFGASHSYLTLLPATYTVTVPVVDSHGNRGSDTKVVKVVL